MYIGKHKIVWYYAILSLLFDVDNFQDQERQQAESSSELNTEQLTSELDLAKNRYVLTLKW